jgi:hypothetical protein
LQVLGEGLSAKMRHLRQGNQTRKRVWAEAAKSHVCKQGFCLHVIGGFKLLLPHRIEAGPSLFNSVFEL